MKVLYYKIECLVFFSVVSFVLCFFLNMYQMVIDYRNETQKTLNIIWYRLLCVTCIVSSVSLLIQGLFINEYILYIIIRFKVWCMLILLMSFIDVCIVTMHKIQHDVQTNFIYQNILNICLICGYGVDLTGMVLAVIYKNSRFIMICNASQITIALVGLFMTLSYHKKLHLEMNQESHQIFRSALSRKVFCLVICCVIGISHGIWFMYNNYKYYLFMNNYE